MDASPLLLDRVAATTDCRDRDDIELSLTELLLHFLAADCVTLFKLRHEGATVRATHCLAVTANARGGVDVSRGRGNVQSLAMRPSWRACIAGGAPRVETLAPGRTESLFPVHSESGLVMGLLEVLGPRAPAERDLTLVNGVLRIVRNHLALLDYGERDTLTGLLNRKTFEAQFDKLRRELGSDTRGPEGCWIGVVDIDHFKAVNDGYGHVIGDEVLLLVSQIIQRNFRAEDRVYRFGGEEFVILLCDTESEVTATVMERLRAAVAAHRFPQLGTVTVSIGWTRIRSHDLPTSAIERADEALYHAKENGRNRVFHYEQLLAEGKVEGEAGGPAHDIELF